MLATFNILPVKDDKVMPILPDHTIGTTGVARRSHPYPAALIPRNAEIVELAMREAENADEQLKGWL